MDLNALKAEIQNDPAGIGYAAHLPHSPGAVVDLLNARAQVKAKSRMVTARGIMASYGLGPAAGAVFLDKLDALAGSVPAVNWAMKFLQTEAGVDVGEPATQAMLTALIGQGGITADEVNGVKAMAIQPASRAEILFGDGVQVAEADLRAAGVV